MKATWVGAGHSGDDSHLSGHVEKEWGALLGWAAAAWKCRSRDQWIGWTRDQRWTRLRFVANNARFLTLPDGQVPNLASKILVLNTCRLREDWTAVYGHPVALAETFVDPARFTDTSYRAVGRQSSTIAGKEALY